MTTLDHEPVIEVGQLRIVAASDVGGLIKARRNTDGPSLVIARDGELI
jgi:hypothetical protein